MCVCVYLCIQRARGLIKYSFPWLAPGHFNCPWLLPVSGLLLIATHMCAHALTFTQRRACVDTDLLWLETHTHKERQKASEREMHTYRPMHIHACIHSSLTNMHPRCPALIRLSSSFQPLLKLVAKTLSWLISRQGPELCLWLFLVGTLALASLASPHCMHASSGCSLLMLLIRLTGWIWRVTGWAIE